jgi:ABC-type oligopeptide transport system substrate-binding subunit
MVESELTASDLPGGPPPAPEPLPSEWGWSVQPDGGATSSGPRWRRVLLALVAIVAAAALVVHLLPAPLGPGPDRTSAASSSGTVTVLAGEPSSIDPAHHGDLGSAQYVSQLFETLTAVDPKLDIRPALAASWQVSDNGTKVTFTLRDNLEFSDGSPLTAGDVVHSWRRLFTPKDPSPLASLIADVKGARELLSGQSTDTSTLGVSAPNDKTVVVDMVQGGGNLPAIVSSAPFAVVPSSVGDGEFGPTPGMVGSGAYTYASKTGDALVLEANPHYWAGKPSVSTVNMLLTLNGKSPVDEFSAGTMDVTPLSFTDAGWIGYDRQLGPSLREDPNLSVTYYGFETRKGPFADVRVRQAFAAAIDWRRLAQLQDPLNSAPATGMVPAGMPGQPTGDFLPAFDVAKAKQLLAAAGYPNGQGLPTITFIGGGGGGSDAQIVAMLKANLGVTVDYQTMDFGPYQSRLATDPPDIWSISWVADYPGPNDFLGVLLGTGSTANQGGWSNADFDAAVAQGSSASDPATALAAYTKAEQIIGDQVPVVPVSYGRSWSLVADGLHGAAQNGTGILRLAGLAWSGQ